MVDKKNINHNSFSMPAGRPTLYTEHMTSRVFEYLASCTDKRDDKDRIEVNLPSVVGLAGFLGVGKATLYVWGDQHPEFQDGLNAVLEAQEQRLLQQGLAGAYNPTIAKLCLSSSHGYRERTDAEVSGKNGGAIDTSISVSFIGALPKSSNVSQLEQGDTNTGEVSGAIPPGEV